MKLNNKIVIIIVVLSAALLILNKNNLISNYKHDERNIKLETRAKGYIPLSNKQEQIISKYLENQSLVESKNPVDCIVFEDYTIYFNSYIISFDKSMCYGYLRTKNDYYQIDISKELAEYIIKISK